MRFLSILLLLSVAALSSAVDTLPKLFGEVRTRAGAAQAGARVLVTLTGTGTNATLLADDESTVKINPLTTDSNGLYMFKTSPGVYDITVSLNGTVIDQRAHVPMGNLTATVSSVALTMPAEFSVAGSPITTSGTFTVTEATQSANTLYAGPTTGAAAAPGFRAVVPADLTTALTTPPAIGGTTPAAGTFAALVASTIGSGTVTLSDAANLVVGSTTGTKIGTATSQKLGFFNATPVVQPSSTTDLRTALINLGLYASGGASPLNLNGGALTAASVTNASLTSGRVPYATTGGLMTDDSAFTRGTLTLGVDPSTDNTLTTGYGKLGLATSATSTSFYIAQASNFNSTDYALSQGSGGTTRINAKTGNTVVLQVNATGKLTVGGSSATFASGVPVTISDTTASTTTGTGSLIVSGGVGVAGTLNGAAGKFTSITDSGLTSGRIPFASTGGLLADSSLFGWDGNVLVAGTTTGLTNVFNRGSTLTPRIQSVGTGTTAAAQAQTIFNATAATAPSNIIARSRGATVGDYTIVQAGDLLGLWASEGSDGTDFERACRLEAAVDLGTTPANNDVAGRWIFYTYLGGTATRSLQVDSKANVYVTSSDVSSLSAFNGGGTGSSPKFQVLANNNANGAVAAIAQFRSNATDAGVLILAHSRGTSPGTYTASTTADLIGAVHGEAADGTDFNRAASMEFYVTGTVGDNRTPGEIRFKTGADAAGSALTTAMTMTNAQVIQENGTTEASAVGTANVVNSGGLGVAKRSFLGTIGSTFKGNVNAGVQDATAAAAGQVGEVISASVTSYTNYTTTATIQNLTSISLTAGDWMEYATITYYGNSATNTTDGEFVSYLCDTTASATGAVEGETLVYDDQPVTGTLHRTVTISFHENISASKTKYLNGKAAFTLGNPQFTCSLKAVRIR